MRLLWALMLFLLAPACARTDLGASCHLLSSTNTEVLPTPRQNIVQSGNGECQQFACVSFDGAAAMCSQPCAHLGDGCGNGYRCRSTVLEPQLMEALRARTQGTDLNHDGVDDYDALTAGLTDSLFCGPG